MRYNLKKHIKALAVTAALSSAAILCSCAMSVKQPSASFANSASSADSSVISPVAEGTVPAAPEIIDYTLEENDMILPPESIGDPAMDFGADPSAIKSPDSANQNYGEYKTLKEKEAAEKAAKEKAEKEAAEKAAKEKAAKEAAEKAAKEKAQKQSDTSTKTDGTVRVNTAGSSISSIIKNNSFSSSSITVYQSSSRGMNTDTSALMKAIKSRNAKCAVLAVRLRDGAAVGYNCDMKIRCKSTIKVVTALYAYKQYAAGNISLDTQVAYSSKYYFGGAGKIRNSAIGTKYSLRTLINYSIIYSDNSAYLMVHDQFNSSSIKTMLKNLGCSCYNDASSAWPSITARDAALWWNEIYNYCKNTKSASGLWNACLNACGTQVKQALGMKYNVAHKTGSGDGYYHDAGIVLSSDPYIYVILTYDSSAGDSTHKTYLMGIASAIHKMMNP